MQSNSDIYQQLLMGAMHSEPGTLPLCLAILQDLRLAGISIQDDILAESLNLALERHGKLAQASEVVWALFGCLLFGVHVDKRAADAIGTNTDDFVVLLAMECRRQGLMPALNMATWEPLMSAYELHGRHWLLAYEAAASKFLPSAHINDDVSFSAAPECPNPFLQTSGFSPPNSTLVTWRNG